MEGFYSVDLTSYVNNRGCTTSDQYKLGFLSLGASSLPAEEFPFGQTFEFEGVPFVFHQLELNDNLEFVGQRIEFPPLVAKRLHVLGVSSNGDSFDNLHFLRDGNRVHKSKLYLSDFISPEPTFSDRKAMSFSYLYMRSGRNDNFKPHVWYYCIELPSAMELDALQVEDNPSMHVFAMTFELAGTTQRN